MVNFTDDDFSAGEIEVFLLGLSFTPTPQGNIHDFEKDIFQFTRKLRLQHHFADNSHVDKSLIKKPSTWIPKRGKSVELERLVQPIEQMNIWYDRAEDNIPHLRKALSSLIQKTRNNEIIIKPADKGEIIVVQSAKDYQEMCLRHLEDEDYYEIVPADPTELVQQEVVNFAKKYEETLTNNEYRYLTAEDHKLSNFYMLPKLHKNAELNRIIEESNTEYLHVKLSSNLEGRPICSGPAYHTRGISMILHHILHPALEKVEHILKDTFDFVERVEKFNETGTKLVSWDIKSLYTNIRHDLFHDAISYWIDRLRNELPLLSRFSKEFVLEGLRIILKFNYFYFNGKYIHQIKGTAMGTTFAVVGSNLVIGFLEVKMFVKLPDLYPRDFVDIFIRNYFRFLDDLFHKWLEQFDIQPFQQILDGMDRDLKFILDNMSAKNNFLDVKMKINEDNELMLDVYYKATNSFGYLRFTSCHPFHTRKNIATSLAKRIVRIVSHNRGERIDHLTQNLRLRNYPKRIVDEALAKVFQPQRHPDKEEIIVFTHTHNPNHIFDRKLVTDCLEGPMSRSLQKSFGKTKTLVTTRQPPNLRKMLVRARFDAEPISRPLRLNGLFPCGNCVFCRKGYIQPTQEVVLRRKGKTMVWKYNRHFSCDSKNILYFLTNKWDDEFYLGKAKILRQRTSKHKSDVENPKNSNCKECTNHLREVSNLEEPYFNIYPFFYVPEPHLRDFMEHRFIRRYKPTLNANR